MAEFIIDCPHCGNTVQVQSYQSNQDFACPHCRENFTVPQLPDIKQSLPSEFDTPDPERKSLRDWNGWILVRGVIYFALLSLAVICISGIYSCTKSRQEAAENRLRHRDNVASFKKMIVMGIEDGFYRGCTLDYDDVELKPENEASFDRYTGTATFSYNGKKRTRRVVAYANKLPDGKLDYQASICFDYDSKPDHLLEDAEILWKHIQWHEGNIIPLAGYEFVSARIVRKNVVAITVAKDKETREFILEVTETYNGVQWKIVDK